LVRSVRRSAPALGSAIYVKSLCGSVHGSPSKELNVTSQPAPEAPKYAPIVGPRLRLRPVEERDLPDLVRWNDEPEVLHWWDEHLDSLDAARAEFMTPDPVSPGQGYIIEVIADGHRAVGYIQWWRRSYDEEDSWSAGVDIFLGDASDRDRGVGTEAMRTLLAWLFEDQKLHRVTIDPEVGNARAIRSYQKAGFRLDGVLRHNDFLRGEYVDTQMLSLLEDEWPAVKAEWQRAPRCASAQLSRDLSLTKIRT
jgi:aminoglycoside 6'-N-acetyltransferase